MVGRQTAQRLVRAVLVGFGCPVSAEDIAAAFAGNPTSASRQLTGNPGGAWPDTKGGRWAVE